MVYEAFRYAKKNGVSICASWLDLANAYGSVRHSFISFALRWYRVPPFICKILFQYYESIFAHIRGDSWSSDWFWISIGVPQGCTTSTIVFDIIFQLILDIHETLAHKFAFRMNKADISLLHPTYADDTALLSPSPKKNQLSIDAFIVALNWSVTLKLKPKKCRSLAFKKFRKSSSRSVSRYSAYDPLL